MAMAPAISGAAGMTPDPTAGAGAAPPGADASAGGDTGDQSDTVVVTITKGSDGSYTVYAGDEPDGDEGESEDDDAAMGGPGAAPSGGDMSASSGGQHADSIGQALKITMDMLQADKSSAGGEGSADDQFAAGFNGGTGGA